MNICPRCGSDEVDWIIPQNWSIWECKVCGYTGPIIEGSPEIAAEIRENYIKNIENQEEDKDKNNTENEKTKIENENKNNDYNYDDEFDESEEEDLSDEEIDRRLDELDI